MAADWIGAIDQDAQREGCLPAAPALPGKPLAELATRQPDPAELLKHRFLCEGGGALLVAPTGVGKSSFAMQAVLCWATGIPALGIHPARPLKSWVIQAENDEGDLVEERDGIAAGLVAEELLTEEQLRGAYGCIRIVSDCHQTGDAFGGWLREALEKARGQNALPDLLVVDPVLSFLGGDSLQQRDVGRFLRNTIAPILCEYSVAIILIHHANKPVTSKEHRLVASQGEHAYLGAGSAEWANWPRAVLVIERTAREGVFRLHAAKRGKRLEWQDSTGAPTSTRYIAHARERGQIFWRECSSAEIKDVLQEGRQAARAPVQVSPRQVASLAPQPRKKADFEAAIQEAFKVGRQKAEEMVRQCLAEGLLAEAHVSANPHYKLIGPPGQTEAEAKRLTEAYQQSKIPA